MSEGHPDAPFYPVHRVWEESKLVVSRKNHESVTQALLLQLAVSSAVTGEKSAVSAFKELIEDLTDGAEG